MIQQMLAIWSLVPLPFLKPAWTSGSSWFGYCWSLAWIMGLQISQDPVCYGSFIGGVWFPIFPFCFFSLVGSFPSSHYPGHFCPEARLSLFWASFPDCLLMAPAWPLGQGLWASGKGTGPGLSSCLWYADDRLGQAFLSAPQFLHFSEGRDTQETSCFKCYGSLSVKCTAPERSLLLCSGQVNDKAAGHLYPGDPGAPRTPCFLFPSSTSCQHHSGYSFNISLSGTI